jgi:RNA polymerase sigma-70 factor (ECF subfamily)
LSGYEGTQAFQTEIQGVRAPLDALLDVHDDDALVARLRAGDDVAFGALVDRHRPWLVRLCTRLLDHDAHAAEDAAQESLLKLHNAARRDGRPLRVRPWLTVVARHTCVDQQRRRRPDLPGELPERAVPADDPFPDAALTAAWERLSGRHREVLYLREVLGFSYKEIGAVMDLTLPAVETLVFRARAALRREYERSGGTSFGVGLLGLRLARLGLGRRGDPGMADGLANGSASDGALSGLASRLAQWASSIPGCGEPAMAKLLSVAAGVMVAAVAVLPGVGPLAHTPPASAAGASEPVPAAAPAITTAAFSVLPGAHPGAAPASSAGLKAWLGEAVPADWVPHRTRSTATAPPPAPLTGPAPDVSGESRPRITPLRDAAGVPPSDRPTLRRPVRGDDGEGPIRSLLPERPDPAGQPERQTHPLRALLADPSPLPLEPPPTDPPIGGPGPGPASGLLPADLLPADLPPAAPPAGPAPIPAPAPGAGPLIGTVAPGS